MGIGEDAELFQFWSPWSPKEASPLYVARLSVGIGAEMGVWPNQLSRELKMDGFSAAAARGEFRDKVPVLKSILPSILLCLTTSHVYLWPFCF